MLCVPFSRQDSYDTKQRLLDAVHNFRTPRIPLLINHLCLIPGVFHGFPQVIPRLSFVFWIWFNWFHVFHIFHIFIFSIGSCVCNYCLYFISLPNNPFRRSFFDTSMWPAHSPLLLRVGPDVIFCFVLFVCFTQVPSSVNQTINERFFLELVARSTFFRDWNVSCLEDIH